MKSLKDNVVLVVGGGSGIGLEIGRSFAREHAHVVLAARSEGTLEKAKADAEAGWQLDVRTCDASDRQQVRELIAFTNDRFGPVDILVYSAGINFPRRSFADVEPEEFDTLLAVNTTGAFNCLHAVLPQMRESRQGLIFNIVSTAGLRVGPVAGAPYCASKFAQSALGTFANVEAAQDGVRLTNIYPGETDTPILDQRPFPPPPERRAQMLKPLDIAAMVLAVAKLPPHVSVPEIVMTPTYQPFA